MKRITAIPERTYIMDVSVSTVVILLVIVVIGVFAARRMIASFSGKGGCHGGGGSRIKTVKVSDIDEAHYPYAHDIKVSGMTCGNCVANVENSLNAIKDTWARVDLTSGTAHVLSKSPIDVGVLEKAVTDSGYYVARVR